MALNKDKAFPVGTWFSIEQIEYVVIKHINYTDNGIFENALDAVDVICYDVIANVKTAYMMYTLRNATNIRFYVEP